MSFVPYHRFQNGRRIERIILSLRTSSSISDAVYKGFHRYHPALIHKLRSANYNLNHLEEKLTNTDIQEAADPSGDFMFEVNMFIDGFFYNCGSAMDILARVVLMLFGQALPDRVYFGSAYETINANRQGDPILNRLDSPSWRDEFIEYRNTLTHELIIATSYQIHIDNVGGQQTHKIVFPVPDDPRAEPGLWTYRQNPSILEYSKRSFRRVLGLINVIYGDIAERADKIGGLPL